MVECGICFTEHKEGELELHREMCVVLLMFRCTLCNVDFVSKEGLWNHLDLHEIADESKELHYEEIKAKHKLHQCVLCNDQRAYSEYHYWNHVHDIHDGFFLWCSDCEEHFRSEQDKSNHELSQCKVKYQAVASNFADVEVDQVPIRVSNASETDSGLLSPEMRQPKQRKREKGLLVHEPSSVKEIAGSECISGLSLKDTSDPEMSIENPSSEEASCTECSHCGIKESNAVSLVCHILTHHEPVGCDICGITSPSLFEAQNHKKMGHNKSKNKCPHCSMQFAGGKPLQKHILRCKNLKFPCKFCGIMSTTMSAVTEHETRYCRAKIVLNDGINVSKEQGQKSVETGLSTENSLVFNKKYDGSASSTMREKTVLSQSGFAKSKCYYCNADFSCPGYLIHHLKSYHELTKCDICGMTILGISSPRKHRVLCHTEPRFVCPNCGRKFYSKDRYNAHWLSCERKKLICEICGHRYKTVNAVNWHKRKEHSDRITLGETKISSEDDPGLPTVNLSTKVDSAALQENAKDDEGFRSSRQSSTQERNSDCYEEIQSLEDSRPGEHSLASVNDDDDTDSHMDEKESRMRAVATLKDSCEIQVGSEKISQPLVENPSVQQYRCSICDVTSTDFSYIRQHMLTSHKDGMFQCHVCSKKYYKRRDMEVHAAACVDRKFSCDFCGKTFKCLKSVETHKKRYCRYHRGSEPLRNVIVEGTDCSEEQKLNCAEEIDLEKSSEETLVQQHEGVNPSSGSSNAKCPYCVKSFFSKCLLSRHIDQRHEPSACDICGLTFANVMKARYHKTNTHLKQTKFECPYCPLKYVVAKLYEQHLSICKSKEFSCDVCSKKFVALRFVVKHKTVFHQDKESSKKAQHGRRKDSKKQNQNQPEKNRHEKEVSLLHGSSGSQVHGMKEVELISEIKIEDTMLQEQEHPVPNEDQEKSSTSTAARADQRKICKRPHGSNSKVVKLEDTALANGIKIKEEFQKKEDEGSSKGVQRTTEISEYNGIPSDPNDESLVCHEAGDQVGPCFRIKTQSKDTENKLRIKEHNSDGSETRKSKRIRIKEEN